MFFLPLTAPSKSYVSLDHLISQFPLCRDCICNLWIYSCIMITSVIGANQLVNTIARGVLNVKCCMMSTAGRVYDLCVSYTRTLQYSKLQSFLSNSRLIIIRACENIANFHIVSWLYRVLVLLKFALKSMHNNFKSKGINFQI